MIHRPPFTIPGLTISSTFHISISRGLPDGLVNCVILSSVKKSLLDKILDTGAPPTGGQRFLALDGLRGLALLGVLVAHLPRVFPAYQKYLIGAGDVGVDLFFALSAFLLYYPCLKSGIPPSLGRYYVRRFWRIMPAYLVAVLITSYAVPMVRSATPEAMIANLLFFQNFRPDWSKAVIASAWFMVPLVQFYLLFPFLAGILLRRPWVGMLTLLGLAMAAQLWLLKHPPNFPFYLNWPFLALPFCFGLLAAQLIFFYRERFGAFAGMALLLLGFHAGYLRPWLEDKGVWLLLGMRGTLICGLCALTIVGVLSCKKGLLFSLFNSKFLRLIGLTSYGAFLLHYPLRWVLSNHWSPLAGLILMIPFSLLLGTLSYIYLESPLLRRMTGGRPGRQS